MFVTFEGVSGSGKSTQSNILYNKIKDNNKNVVLTREPGSMQNAELIRNLLIGNNLKYPMSEILMLMSARYEHFMDLILPTIKNNGIVICDRFIDSTFVYQGYTKGIPINIIKKLHAIVFDQYKKYINPDLTFILGISVETMKKRLGKRYNKTDLNKTTLDPKDQYNYIEHRKICLAYDDIIKNDTRYRYINSNDKNIQDISLEIDTIIKKDCSGIKI